MSDYFPNEVLTDILLRVPVKSLLRFRRVSKTWNLLIASPAFINTHLNRALQRTNIDGKSKHDRLLFRHYYSTDYVEEECSNYITVNEGREECFSLHMDDASFPHNPYLKLHFPYTSADNKHYFQIVGSVNGIVCLVDKERCILWNPSVNRVMMLPYRFQYDPDCSITQRLGFGYDHITNDHKLVRLVYFPTNDQLWDPPVVEIFRLSTNSWRQIAAPGLKNKARQSSSSSQAFVSGAFHWIAHTSPTQGAFSNVILAFDMANDVFHEIPLPSCFAEKSDLNMTVAVHEGLLSLVPYNSGFWIGGRSYSKSVWIMTEYAVAESWIKLFNIDIQEPQLRRVLSFRNNGEVILIRESHVSKELVSYECNTQQGRDLKFSVGKSYSEKIFSIDTYMESLVLLDVGNVL